MAGPASKEPLLQFPGPALVTPHWPAAWGAEWVSGRELALVPSAWRLFLHSFPFSSLVLLRLFSPGIC